MATAQLESILDIDILEQYCDAIGADTLLKSVVLFEQLMPEYIGNLIDAKESRDKDALCAEAHKLKGAAGSVGLKRIQHFSQLLQYGDTQEWPTEYKVWMQEIVDNADQDLATLKRYLESKA